MNVDQEIHAVLINPNSYFAPKAPFRVEERASTNVFCHCGRKEQKLGGSKRRMKRRWSGISTLKIKTKKVADSLLNFCINSRPPKHKIKFNHKNKLQIL